MRMPRGLDRQTFEIVEGWPYVLGLLTDVIDTRTGTRAAEAMVRQVAEAAVGKARRHGAAIKKTEDKPETIEPEARTAKVAAIERAARPADRQGETVDVTPATDERLAKPIKAGLVERAARPADTEGDEMGAMPRADERVARPKKAKAIEGAERPAETQDAHDVSPRTVERSTRVEKTTVVERADRRIDGEDRRRGRDDRHQAQPIGKDANAEARPSRGAQEVATKIASNTADRRAAGGAAEKPVEAARQGHSITIGQISLHGIKDAADGVNSIGIELERRLAGALADVG